MENVCDEEKKICKALCTCTDPFCYQLHVFVVVVVIFVVFLVAVVTIYFSF